VCDKAESGPRCESQSWNVAHADTSGSVSADLASVNNRRPTLRPPPACVAEFGRRRLIFSEFGAWNVRGLWD
jgi:hypothetical protein